MKSNLKVWTGLGLATALVGAGLTGCSGESGESGEAGESAIAGETGEGEGGEGEGGEGEGGEGEGGEGEGGEGEAGSGDGEGGIEVSQAASDPVIYGSALAVVQAHAIAARDAYAIGRKEEAAEMFGHPVSEVLADMDPLFEELGVENFKAAMNEASEAALKPDNAKGVEAAYGSIAGALAQAGEKAPTTDLSTGAVAAGIVADQIGRAAAMYGQAASQDIYPPYLDGYGFYKSASAEFERRGAAIKTYNSGLYSDIESALDLLAAAYPSVERPDSLDIEQGQLLGASSKVNLGLPSV